MGQPVFRLSQSHSWRSRRLKHQTQVTVHTSNSSEQRGRWGGRREREQRWDPPACFGVTVLHLLLFTALLLVSPSKDCHLDIKAAGKGSTVHYSLAKPAKQSRSVTAALGCFHPPLKCSQAPWQTFCTRHRFEKEMRVAFPLDTTGGISDRQNVITWPGVQPGAEPKTPILM